MASPSDKSQPTSTFLYPLPPMLRPALLIHVLQLSNRGLMFSNILMISR